MDIAKLFDEISNKMKSDIDQARTTLPHAGMKGSAFEESLREFLRRHLPKSLDISTGIIIDSKGNASRQLDIIVSDSFKTPIFFKSGEIRVIPVECVYAVIEVKANLDEKVLLASYENMKSVRILEKAAYYKPSGVIIYSDNLYGKEWDIWPINYFIFSYDSVDLADLAAKVDKLHKENILPEWKRIDLICVHDKGVICNQLADGKFSALPEPNSKLMVCNTKRALLLFYSLISTYLFQTRLPNFRFINYLGQMKFQ